MDCEDDLSEPWSIIFSAAHKTDCSQSFLTLPKDGNFRLVNKMKFEVKVLDWTCALLLGFCRLCCHTSIV